MSASREKKQRQGAGLSEKALQAQQEQAARQRRTVVYTVIGVVIAVVVAALLVWRTGFFQSRATAATVGGTNLTAAELSYYYYNARMDEFYMYDYFGLSVPADSDVADSATGKTYRERFLENALSAAREDLALADEARRTGHTEADVKDSLDAQIKAVKTRAAASGVNYASYLKAMYGPYMSAGVYEKMCARSMLADLVYSEKNTALTGGYTEADLKAYYDADNNAASLDTFEYSYLYFTPDEVDEEDEDGNARDEDTLAQLEGLALAAARANAGEALEALQGGGSVSSLVDEYELADNRYGDHLTIVGISSAPSVIQEKLRSMKKDDAALVENGEAGYYVVILHSRELVEDPTKDVRHILIRAETATDGDGNPVAPTDEAWAAAKEQIEAIQAEYEAGDRTEDSFAALANAKSDDGDGTTGGLYTKIDVNDSYVPEFLDWIFSDGRKAGDTGIVQHDAGNTTNSYWGYHFIYMVGDNEARWKRETRKTLAKEALNAWQEELEVNYQAALTDGANTVGR